MSPFEEIDEKVRAAVAAGHRPKAVVLSMESLLKLRADRDSLTYMNIPARESDPETVIGLPVELTDAPDHCSIRV